MKTLCSLLAGILLLLALVFLSGCAPVPAQAGPVPQIDTGVSSDSWAAIPAGEFAMGQHAQITELANDYEMMVTDVTNAQYARFLNEALAAGAIKITEDPELGRIAVSFYPGDEFHGAKHELEISAGDWILNPLNEPGLRFEEVNRQFAALSGYENHPAVMVTWFGARAYCEFYRWRLPSGAEWEKAARGTDARPYPWGGEIDRQNANFYSSHDIFEKVFGAPGDTTPVGFYNGRSYDGYATLDSPSPYGLYDMAGNVWQWVADITEGTHYRLLRGGSKLDYAYNLRAWTTNSAGPDYYSPSIGFRCAR